MWSRSSGEGLSDAQTATGSYESVWKLVLPSPPGPLFYNLYLQCAEHYGKYKVSQTLPSEPSPFPGRADKKFALLSCSCLQIFLEKQAWQLGRGRGGLHRL